MVLGGVAAGGFPAAQAQVTLPDLHISSRLGKGGITGASTTIISREDIARAPQLTIADILSREAGVQTSSFYGGVNGAGTTVDLRGFGVTGPSNTLVLINGRRLNDWDLPGFDLSTIAKESIERIEITRGNSGAVLYGDGAVGGVINIVTRSGADQPNQLRIEGGFGSFRSKEGNITASGSSGGFSAFLNGNAFQSDGWRDNNELRQKSGVADFRWATAEGSVYFNLAGDTQDLRLPGPRNVTIGLNQLVNNPRGTNTPFDYGDKQGTRATVGFTRMFGPGMELIVDAGIRQKEQQSGFFSLFSEAFVDTELTTKSLTPRVRIDQPLFGLPSRILAGVDVYDTDYQQNRSLFEYLPPIHRYTANQKSLAGYWQQTVSILPTTDISFGGRIQKNKTDVQDAYDPTAPQNFANPQGLPLNQSEVNHAYHLGAEHELFTGVTLFGRMAQSFRVPNIDERVGASPVLTITDFDLRTQKSHDYEGGVRFRFGPFDVQSSVYDMHLTDELHFNPVTGANVNLDPTRRTGVETIASWQVTPDVRLRGNLTYTNAKFVAGPFSGNQIPVVSPWTASAGLSWNIFGPQLVFDANLRYFSQRYLDGNEINANAVYFIPATTLVDLRIGGQLDAFFWSLAVQNVFDRQYYDYALDTSFLPFFPFYSFYPLPGRTFMAKAGMQF
jgi:iron complex outermembrane receptor protein